MIVHLTNKCDKCKQPCPVDEKICMKCVKKYKSKKGSIARLFHRS